MSNVLKLKAQDPDLTRAIGDYQLQGEPPSTNRNNVSNWVETTDGRMMCAFYTAASVPKYIKIGYCDKVTPIDAFISDYAIEDVVQTPIITVGFSIDANQVALFRMPDDSILMFLEDDGVGVLNCKVYRSVSGNGEDFSATPYGSVWTNTLGGTISGRYEPIYPPIRLSTGTLIFGCSPSLYYGGYYFCCGAVYRSTDNGVTWSRRVVGSYTGQTRGGQPAVLPSGVCVWDMTTGSGSCNQYDSSNDGLTWTVRVNFASNFGLPAGFTRTGQYYASYLYDDTTKCLYRIHAGVTMRAYRLRERNFANNGHRVSLNWEWMVSFTWSPIFSSPTIYKTPCGYVAVSHMQSDGTSLVQTLGLPYHPLIERKARRIKFKVGGVVYSKTANLLIRSAQEWSPPDGEGLVVPDMPTMSVDLVVVAGDILSIDVTPLTVPDIPTILETTE